MTLVADLTQFRADLSELKRVLNAEKSDRIAKAAMRLETERLGTKWFAELHPQLGASGLSPEVIGAYSERFATLIRLAGGKSQRSSYLTELGALLKNWRDELVLPLQTAASPKQSLLAGVLADVQDRDESAYLAEAISAANHGLYRAAAVLGWCAAIDRIHRRVEAIGFSAFNVASSRMASETKGRYKRFSSPQNVHSLAEVREVFDTVILWVIEGMGLIDTNEHTRLRGSFELRSQSAHPGNAPITEYNLLAFFSDINEIVLKNPRFAVERSAADGET